MPARLISADQVRERNGNGENEFWGVVDGYVVDATEFMDSHPGGLRKLLSTNAAATGATGAPFGFSFSRGRNAHFAATAKRFEAGVQRFLAQEEDFQGHLPPVDVNFPSYGKITLLGRLDE